MVSGAPGHGAPAPVTIRPVLTITMDDLLAAVREPGMKDPKTGKVMHFVCNVPKGCDVVVQFTNLSMPIPGFDAKIAGDVLMTKTQYHSGAGGYDFYQGHKSVFDSALQSIVVSQIMGAYRRNKDGA